jgi:UDP-N-acetyl-D-glucosamine dehydrogenase
MNEVVALSKMKSLLNFWLVSIKVRKNHYNSERSYAAMRNVKLKGVLGFMEGNYQSTIAIIGLGFVGLPLAMLFAEYCFRVIGIDIDRQKINALNQCQSYLSDIQDEDIKRLMSRSFEVTSDYKNIKKAQTCIICVPTPLKERIYPDLSYLQSVAYQIAQYIPPQQLIVLESSTYPGTTEEVLLPILEGEGYKVGRDFYVGYSPERIDPGNARFGLHNTPKIVGADTEEASARARDLYRRIVDEVVVARGTREAESAKLLENTYRHVNIALVNEMARFFHELDIDFWDVIGLAATKPFGFQSFTPGPGVGGHCIPIDPNYLSHRVRSQLGYSFRFVELAQEINSGMPAYVVQRAVELLNGEALAARGSRVLLLGVTYKPDIADQRESPAVEVAQRLLDMGAEVLHSDPHVPDWTLVPEAKPAGADAVAAAREADLVILLQDHSGYDLDEITAGARLFLDTRGAASGSGVTRL